MNGASGGRAVPRKAAATSQVTTRERAAVPAPKATSTSSGGGSIRLGAKVVSAPTSERPTVQAPRARPTRTSGSGTSGSGGGSTKAGPSSSATHGVSREAMLQAAALDVDELDPFLAAASFVPETETNPAAHKSSRKELIVEENLGAEVLRRTGSKDSVPPRQGSIDPGTTVLVPKAPPSRKKAASSKKRRSHGASLTRPQPFSFSTSTRRGRGGVDEENERKGLRERLNNAEVQVRQAQKFISAAVNVAAGLGVMTTGMNNPPDTASSGGTASQDQGSPRWRGSGWHEDVTGSVGVLCSGGASSSTDHWEPQSSAAACASSSSNQVGAVLATNATTSGSGGGGVFSSSSLTRRHFERQRASATSAAKETSPPPTDDANAMAAPPHNTPMCTNMGLRNRHFERPATLHVPSKEGAWIQDSSRSAQGSGGGASGVSGESHSPLWNEFSPASWGPPSSTCSSSQPSPRVHRRALHTQRGAPPPPVGQIAHDDHDSSSSSLAAVAQDNEPDRGVSSFGTERARSTSIVRGRLGSHLARGAHVANDLDAERENKHVTFCADRSGGVEVVQFSVDEGPVPVTTRGPRRVFGGDLQSHVSGGRSGVVDLRSAGGDLQSHISGGRSGVVDLRSAGANVHGVVGPGHLERLAPGLARSVERLPIVDRPPR